MALNLSKTEKGITVSYWQIYQNTYLKDSNQTLVRLRAYKDQATRNENIRNFIDLPEFQKSFKFDGELTVTESYAQAKQPEYRQDTRPQNVLDSLGIFVDAEKYILESEGGAKKNFNEFANATDILEE